MEAEELDRLFRARLAELEQVPDFVWDDSATWGKIGPKVKKGWGKFWTWGVMSTIVLLGILVWFVKPRESSVPKAEKVLMEEAALLPFKKSDTLVKLVKKPLASTRNLPHNLTVSPQDTFLQVPDTAFKTPRSLAFTSKSKAYKLVEPKLNLVRFGKWRTLNDWDMNTVPQKNTKLYLPQTPVLRLHIGNTLNLSNALKLFETVQDQGYSFRYSYQYSPNPFANRSIPFQKQDSRVIYINDYDK